MNRNGWLRWLTALVLLAVCGTAFWYCVSVQSLNAQRRELLMSLDTSRGRERKQQMEYNQVAAELPEVQAQLDEVQPQADAALAQETELRAKRKELRALKPQLEAQVAQLQSECDGLQAQLDEQLAANAQVQAECDELDAVLWPLRGIVQ